MLEGFRKNSNSIVVKTLLFLLIASFAAWGIGDMLRPATTGSSVATVGGVEISAQEVYRDFQREMARMRQLTGDQAVNDNLSMAIGGSVVDRAVNRTLLAVSANDMDVAISDELVRKSIHETEMFQDNGKFSRPRFEQVMFSNQLNEAQYIELVRDDLSREQIISVLVSGATMPEQVAKDLYKHRQEKRSADVVLIKKTDVGELPAPSDADVRKYYDENIKNFMAPEYRKLTLLHITPGDVAENIDVPLENIEDAFAERQGDFKKPARRTVDQIVFSTEDEAKAAAAKLAAGKEFSALSSDVLSLGDVTKEELPEELREATFALSAGSASAPIKSLLGWHIVRVSAVTQAVNPSFEEVRDQLRNALATEMAGEELFGISNDVEDAMGGGATIEEAAKTAGFDLMVIEAADKSGSNTEGTPIKALFNQATILEEAFKLDMNAEPAMKDDGNGGYFMVRVDGVTQSKARSFETVKEVAKTIVADNQKSNAAKTKAEELLKKVKGGTSLMVAAKEASFEVKSEAGFTRFNAPLPQDVVKALFAAKVGETASGETQEGHVIAVLRDIKSMEGTQDQNQINELRRSMANGVSTDLQGQFVNALRTRYQVKVDRGTMNRLFVQEQQ
ncbi:putative Peptidyl-prolyl cis-trans isomerase ppiD [Candidatus Terasakiella magnetica]|uniref:Parvulin-like PPIase n=1 Tax=Candidatus Terasakiella magnetica TaxID=1867952 RepID=A0A1C3RCP9_9PROT|nr:SurA N-terminal domain-containing protein [Candidatus Terasakiella magnetica]SCA55053.1 putative Peptidyl-prolyl cis-trans isomerase ppiD [Candidatus Terasakiella magnetica]